MNIILKCDDFWGKDWEREKLFFDVVLRRNIKISLGVVGAGITTANKEAIDFLKENKDLVEVFNHSFWHVVGKPVKEFYKTSDEYQKESISRTDQIVLERLGVQIETIGFPANACDQRALDFLKDYSLIKNIYYTPEAHNRKEIEQIGKRIINIDGESVIQLHPFAHDFSLEEFEAMVIEKLAQGHAFIFPSEL